MGTIFKNGVSYSGGGGGTSGHTIVNGSGTEYAQRANLKIVNATITDDSANDTTVVTCPSITVDQVVSQGSVNAVSGGAVYTANESIVNSFPYKGFGDSWLENEWEGESEITGNETWTDGTNIYYSFMMYQYVFDKSTSTWSAKTWSGFTELWGSRVWTDGTNIYYSDGSDQYVLDKSTSTWSTKTWNGLTEFAGQSIWTDGTNMYYSSGSDQYVLDKSTSTWSVKVWNGISELYGSDIWTEGNSIYYSSGSDQYVLDKSTSTWSTKTWNGISELYGGDIWTDGTNIYYSEGSDQYVLDTTTSTWSAKTWSGIDTFFGYNIWTDGDNIYYCDGMSSTYYSLSKTRGFGTAASKDSTDVVTGGSKDLITSGAVHDIADGLNNAIANKHKVTLLSVSINGWTSDTTSQSGTTLYKKSVALNHVYVESPSVTIGAATGFTLPTTAEQTAYDLLQYVTCDSAIPCLYLYASDIPTTAFYINVEGVD